MTDPLSLLPKDKDGGLRGGYYKRVGWDELDEHMRRGWRPAELTDNYSCHHDHYGVLCEPPRSWWRRMREAARGFLRVMRRQ